MTKEEHIAIVFKHLQIGDLITHTICAGGLPEHYYTDMDGAWICGKATKESKVIDWCAKTNDIYAGNVTHINRCAVDSLDYVGQKYMQDLREKLAKISKVRK